MPAYRSAAEAEIRDAVVAHLRLDRPDARIIHEINVSTYGPNRLDLIAVAREEIIAVEIKSAKDKLDRLPAQFAAMNGMAHHAVAALHEKFLEEQVTNQRAAHYERDGAFYRKEIPAPFTYRDTVWVYPEKRRAMDTAERDRSERWKLPAAPLETALPPFALDVLWRDELYELCGRLRIAVGRRSNMSDMTQQLRWHCNGKELTRGICAMLRQRRCVEADPEIAERIAA